MIPTHKATEVKKTQATLKAKVKKAEGRQSLLSKTLELPKKHKKEEERSKDRPSLHSRPPNALCRRPKCCR
jgi:hypothetical protein